MSDERRTFEQTKARLEEILATVRRKDTSLEQSLEMLEEGVRLANVCNELIDQTAWRDTEGGDATDGSPAGAEGGEQEDVSEEAVPGTEEADPGEVENETPTEAAIPAVVAEDDERD